MAINNFSQQVDDSIPNYGTVLKELGQTAKDLVQSEIQLMTIEMKQVGQRLGRHSAEAAIFGGLVAISVLPFLAFLVIGLGILLDGQYWLSSLIVAVVCAGVGGLLAYRAYRKIKEEDVDFTHTKSTLDREFHAVQERVNEIKDAARGERHETNQLH